MNPYIILNLKENATDEEVRDSYLKAVKQFPPDHYPDEFGKIANAYEKIQTVAKRRQLKMVDVPETEETPLVHMLHAAKWIDKKRPQKKELFSALKTCMK